MMEQYKPGSKFVALSANPLLPPESGHHFHQLLTTWVCPYVNDETGLFEDT